MDPEIKVEFSVNAGEESEMSTDACRSIHVDKVVEENTSISEEKTPPVTTSASTSSKFGSGSSLLLGEDTVSKKEDLVINKSSIGTDRGRKSSAHSNNSSGKKKVKVDWTPELHKQFVQAVEQLGVDKAVPSRILEIMGVDCLTRHNVASHLQKYRSRRKYLLARETKAATWSRRKQICGTTNRTPNMNARTVPTTGFPPVTPMPHIRPLHVWGHPSADQSLAYMWPGHVASSHSPHAWGTACYPLPQPPPGDPYFWYYHHQDIPAPGTPCFSPHFPPTRFTSLPVPGAPPSIGFSIAPNGQTLPQPSLEPHPTKEAIDAVIGDVLSRPWLPMPIGLKPPSIDSVMLELQRQGITKVPPTCV